MSLEAVEKKKILIGATGSVATIKIPDIISGINSYYNGHVEVKLVPTKNGWDSMNKEFLNTKNVNNFGLVSVNCDLIFLVTIYFEFFNISRTLLPSVLIAY